MGIKSRFLGSAVAISALVSIIPIPACTTDDSADSGDAGSTAGTTSTTGAGGTTTGTATTAGATGTTGSSAGEGGSTSNTVCANPTHIPSANAGIANFDTYDGVSDINKWSFALGGDSSTGVYAGPFAYGDRPSGFPETFEMSTGHDSMYAMRIADTLAQQYGGGMGLWISTCIDASAFSGISFWVRGNSPNPPSNPSGTLTLSMQETLPATQAKPADPIGTCTGTGTTCIHPTFTFPVTDTWTQIKAAWADFKAGDANGTPVQPSGRNITQVQFGVGLVFVPGEDGGPYVPVPAPYELVVDDMTFY